MNEPNVRSDIELELMYHAHRMQQEKCLRYDSNLTR